MEERNRKVVIFIGITYFLTLIFFMILKLNGGPHNPVMVTLVGIPMVFPFLALVLVQKIIYKNGVLCSFGITFRLNISFLYAVLIPIFISLLVQVTVTGLFSISTLLLNIVLGLTIASISALLEEAAWRGFLYNELKTLGIFKSAFLTGVLWSLWHLPVTVLFKYPQGSYQTVFTSIFQLFIFSLLLSYIREKSGSVLAPTLMHGLLNTLVLTRIMIAAPVILITILSGIFILAALLLVESILAKKRCKPPKVDANI